MRYTRCRDANGNVKYFKQSHKQGNKFPISFEEWREIQYKKFPPTFEDYLEEQGKRFPTSFEEIVELSGPYFLIVQTNRGLGKGGSGTVNLYKIPLPFMDKIYLELLEQKRDRNKLQQWFKMMMGEKQEVNEEDYIELFYDLLGGRENLQDKRNNETIENILLNDIGRFKKYKTELTGDLYMIV
jgi:hypothetical protein